MQFGRGRGPKPDDLSRQGGGERDPRSGGRLTGHGAVRNPGTGGQVIVTNRQQTEMLGPPRVAAEVLIAGRWQFW